MILPESPNSMEFARPQISILNWHDELKRLVPVN